MLAARPLAGSDGCPAVAPADAERGYREPDAAAGERDPRLEHRPAGADLHGAAHARRRRAAAGRARGRRAGARRLGRLGPGARLLGVGRALAPLRAGRPDRRAALRRRASGAHPAARREQRPAARVPQWRRPARQRGRRRRGAAAPDGPARPRGRQPRSRRRRPGRGRRGRAAPRRRRLAAPPRPRRLRRRLRRPLPGGVAPGRARLVRRLSRPGPRARGDAGAGRRQPRSCCPTTAGRGRSRRPELLDTVRAFLDARRPLGAELVLLGPRYVPVDVVARVAAAPGASAHKVATACRERLLAFLHPVHGNERGEGWAPGSRPHRSDLVARLGAVDGASHVVDLRWRVDDAGLDPAARAQALVCAGSVEVSA
ncbi:MAG: baseplate J/gp47 family protein [Comamonadaceae bacterium]|nr:baseplate J/gp47 family protein [Comamonadaceae bacterium]